MVAEKSVEERDATIDFLNRRLQASTGRVTELTEKVSELGASSFRLKTSLAELDHCQSEVKHLSHENGSLKSALTEIRNRNAIAEKQNQAAVMEINQLKTEGKRSAERKVELERTLAELKENLATATGNLTGLQGVLENTMNELNSSQNNLQTTQNELKLVRDQEAIWREHAAAWQAYSEQIAVKPAVTMVDVQTDEDDTESRIAAVREVNFVGGGGRGGNFSRRIYQFVYDR